VDPALTVSDADDASLEGATVRISAGFEAGDELVFTDQNGITGSYNGATGVLTLTGTASVADYQAALRSVQFRHTGDNPATSKTVEFKVNDGDSDSAAATRAIAITRVNDAPTLTATSAALSYAEGDGAVAIDGGLTVADPDSTQLSGATVTISSGFDGAQDELAFADTASITGSYNDTTGVLTLTGTASVAAYQTALRSVTYENSSNSPSGTRTVTFQATDAEGATSAGATRMITLSTANDAPVLTTSAGSTAYTEGDPATTIDGALTATDADDTNLESASVRLSAGFQAGDELVFTNQNGITGSYNDATGVLTLTGTASVANYQAALRSIQFRSTNGNPVSSKTVEFKVNDGDVDSNTASKNIAVTAVNSAPQVGAGGTLNYTENDPATAVHSGLTLTEPDGDGIDGASVSITTGFQAGQDVLAWSDNNLADNIVLDALNSGAQTIALMGIDTAANYQAALRAVTYVNSSESPSTASRTVTFSADDVFGATGSDTRTIAVASVDDAPVAEDDSQTVLEDAAATAVPVLTNDTDIDGGPKTISSATNPANGTVVLEGPAGAHTGLTYQPDPDYCNDPPGTTPDTFNYTLNGGDSAEVSITVTCVNDAPLADDETFDAANGAIGNGAGRQRPGRRRARAQ
jgi:trimeric autotransporter adhesin